MKKKIICAFLAIVMLVGMMGVLASCEGDEPKPPEECTEHTDENKDYKCDDCGASLVKKHSKHTDKDGDGKCDVPGCPKKVSTGGGSSGGGEDDTDYYWDSVSFIFQMTNNDASRSLPSTCARYLAGEWKGTVDNIDKAVTQRNNAAYAHAKVEDVEYLYYPNTDQYNWSKVADVIMTEISSLDSDGLPDMYCDMVYDMVAASLQGCFANLYGTVRGQKNNYFPFNEFKEPYYKGTFDEDKEGNGYMYEYMTTLTLSKNKMYLLASDYFTDLVRGFFIVPVNIKLLEEVGMQITGDLVGDGDGFTIDDFYEEVKQRKWTYSKIAEYSKAIYRDELNEGRQDIGDRLGWALSSQGGLSPSGIVYTTACTIINRDLNKEIDDFEYSYPKDNEKLFDLADAISDLVQQEGVFVVNGGTESKVYGASALDAIAARFADDKVLFGGICLLGALENTEYQEMKEGKGFGVVPVPLYSDEIDDEYLTQVHNVGRIGAISVKTQKFEQCTAFLNYQSTHSTEILDDYYEYKLQYDIVNAAPSTVYMMQYIRNHVRSAFDKTFEDAMGAFYDKDENRWHDIFMRNAYQVDMRQKYNDLYDQKEGDLEQLVKFYDGLPD